MSKNKSLIIIISSWTLFTILHFFTPIHHSLFPLHEIFRQLYYLPIIYSSFCFGLKGGLYTSSAVALIYFIHITWQWSLPTGEYINQVIEICMFIIIGFTTGMLVEKSKREQNLYKETAEKLSLSIEQQKEYQKQLIFSERMRSLGELAAGLAHEIKNPLSSIKSSAEVIEDSIEVEGPAKEFIQILSKETNRLNKVVTNFLAFARPVEPELLPAKIEQVLTSVLKLIRVELDKNKILLEKNIEENLPEAAVDCQQLQQVFLNLALNAIQAMEGGGKLSIEIKKEGNYIIISFHDTGTGISKENLEKLFTPFFSTKKQGTGLGLATSYRIIENHGGSISAESKINEGSVFSIKLPLLRSEKQNISP